MSDPAASHSIDTTDPRLPQESRRLMRLFRVTAMAPNLKPKRPAETVKRPANWWLFEALQDWARWAEENGDEWP